MSEALPDGWRETTLGEIATVVTGKTPPTKSEELFGGALLFAKPGDLDGPSDLLATTQTIADAAIGHVPLLPEGTVLVSCIGNLGKTAILRRPGSCNQQINAILPTPHATPEFLHAWARTLGPWLRQNSSATTVSIINK
ncbi:MAG: restriction endonuclease subunit S, partial [Myxococcaceae bacterium]